MSKSAYDRFLRFISQNTLRPNEPPLTFPTHEAKAIMAIPSSPARSWRRYKRDINKAAKRARVAGQGGKVP
jgi:hypothetical protein